MFILFKLLVFQSYITDIVETVITKLSDNWTAGTEPEIEKWTDEKVLELASKEYILVKVPEEIIKPFQLYATNFFHILPITILINTTESEARAQQILSEVTKIIKNNVRLENYVQILPKGVTNNSIEMRGIWEFILFCEAWRNDF